MDLAADLDAHERMIRSVEQATRKLASSGNIDALLQDVLAICVTAVGASGGTMYIHDERNRRLVFRHVLPEAVRERLPFKDIPDDFGVAGKVFQSRKIEITELTQQRAGETGQIEAAVGIVTKSMITAPLNMEGEEPIGVVQLVNKVEGCFSEIDAAVLDTVAAVSTMAILNSRLTDEATRASTLLGMGKVSHDIGNLAASLYANISFSELAMDGLKTQLKDSSAEEGSQLYVDSLQSMLEELKASVDRIVGYSHLVSDLSAGRELRPNFKLAPLANTIETSAAYLEPEGLKNAVALRYDIEKDGPATLHDDLFVFRMVQNLVGNAIKAVRETEPEGWREKVGAEEDAVLGEVVIRYRFDGGRHVIEVHDTGPGMTQEVIERILSGNARSEWAKGSGSGWGMRIVKELAATHDAQLEIESEPGKGSTFRVALPHRNA